MTKRIIPWVDIVKNHSFSIGGYARASHDCNCCHILCDLCLKLSVSLKEKPTTKTKNHRKKSYPFFDWIHLHGKKIMNGCRVFCVSYM